MSRKIVAIGGGLNGRKLRNGSRLPYETERQDREIIRLTGKEHPNFLLLAHSQLPDYQEYFFETMKDVYGKRYGCKCRDLKSYELANKPYAKSLVEWADIVYECGGNTLDMIALWKETGFDEILRKAWEDGKVMCGVSAGANCWFKECSSDSLQIKYGPSEPLIGMECLGFVDGLFVPHCDEPGRQENAREILEESDQVGLLVSNCAALEIIDDKYRIITSNGYYHGIKPYVFKTYWKDGEYHGERVDDSIEFKPLSELLSKDIKQKTK